VLVYRLIPTYWCEAVDGQWEFKSGAFDNATPGEEGESPDDMSVIVGDTLAALGRIPDAIPAETPWAGDDYGVARLEVGWLREEAKQETLRSPEEEEPAHGDVRGKKNGKRRKKLKAHARWVVRPTTPPN
jgi:hypothetical protein